jgi:hypothetical protein
MGTVAPPPPGGWVSKSSNLFRMRGAGAGAEQILAADAAQPPKRARALPPTPVSVRALDACTRKWEAKLGEGATGEVR